MSLTDNYEICPGFTFRYTEKGPEGLVPGKKVYPVMARGGIYPEGPMHALNFQDTYLKVELGLIGLTDICAAGAETLSKRNTTESLMPPNCPKKRQGILRRSYWVIAFIRAVRPYRRISVSLRSFYSPLEWPKLGKLRKIAGIRCYHCYPQTACAHCNQ